MRALAVDGSGAIGKILSRPLVPIGFDVVETGNGEEALGELANRAGGNIKTLLPGASHLSILR